MKRMCGVWIAFTVVTTSACVMKSTYDAAMTELETTKADLAITKEQKQLLVRQVTALEETTKESTSQAETAAAAVQKSIEEAETERKIGEERIAKLKRTIAQLTGKENSLRNALETAQQDAQALKSTVDMYKMKLRDGERTPSFPAPIASTSEPAGIGAFPSASTQAPVDPTANQTITSSGSATDTAAPQSKPQPPASRKPEPADEGLFSTIKGWLVSLWRSIFS